MAVVLNQHCHQTPEESELYLTVTHEIKPVCFSLLLYYILGTFSEHLFMVYVPIYCLRFVVVNWNQQIQTVPILHH